MKSNKKDILGITAYKELVGEVIPIPSIQLVSRRLKTNPVVPGNINRERNVNGEEMMLQFETNDEVSGAPEFEEDSIDISNSEVQQNNMNTFDFSSIPLSDLENSNNFDVSSSQLSETEDEDEPNVETEFRDLSNGDKIDEWLNKETGSSKTTDEVLNEVNTLIAERNSTTDSLATQKEILAKLKERIEQNTRRCEEKKAKLKEENLALTQELSDVLEQINIYSQIEAEQRAFLNDSEGGMKL